MAKININNVKMGTKLAFILMIPILGMLLLGFIAIFNVQNIYTTMKEAIYDELFQSESLILNADRDLYQALVAQKNLLNTGLSADKVKEQQDSFKENIQQVKDRTGQAKKSSKPIKMSLPQSNKRIRGKTPSSFLRYLKKILIPCCSHTM